MSAAQLNIQKKTFLLLKSKDTKNAREKQLEACEEIKPKGPPHPSTILIPSKR